MLFIICIVFALKNQSYSFFIGTMAHKAHLASSHAFGRDHMHPNMMSAHHQDIGTNHHHNHHPTNLSMSSNHQNVDRETPQPHSPPIPPANRDPCCDICNYSAPSKADVMHHIRSVHCSELYEAHSYPRTSYVCHSPGASSVSSVASSRTGLTKSGRVKNRPHACSTCGSTFTQKIHLETHIKNVHELIKPYHCSFCDYNTANKGSLDKHIRTVHHKERPFRCRICEASFGQKVHLDSHVSAVHIQERPHACDQCQYRATTRGLLDKHMCTVHYRERPYECEDCMARFGQKAHLQKHIFAVHRREKPYKCPRCHYAASTRSTLQKHISVIHDKERPFRCDLCPSAEFGQKVHLENHIRQIHSKP